LNFFRFCFTFVLALNLISIEVLALDAGEHAIIGNVAYQQTNKNYPPEIKNLEADISFTYGQLIAMSGDMYVSVEELSLDDPGVLNGFFNRNRNSLKKCINKEIEAIKTSQYYHGCDDLEFAKKKLQYVTLAHDNYEHFAWHNLKSYIELHSKALWYAHLAHLKCTKNQNKETPQLCHDNKVKLTQMVENSDYRKKQKSKYRRFPKLFPRKRFTQKYFLDMPKEKMIRLSLFTNAYADHYLTDAFSAGHLRVPRSQIDSFVENYEKNASKRKREKGSSVSGALTQYLHNLDGSLTGIEVINSLGDEFVIRSDKQLFSRINSRELSGILETNTQISQPVLATKASLNEIFSVIENGEGVIPKGLYSALEYVPFTKNDSKDTLSQRVNHHIEKHGSIKQAIKSMSSEMQLVYRSSMLVNDISYKTYFNQFVTNIPVMMQELRQQIKHESQDEKLNKRIPPKLLMALLKLN